MSSDIVLYNDKTPDLHGLVLGGLKNVDKSSDYLHDLKLIDS